MANSKGKGGDARGTQEVALFLDDLQHPLKQGVLLLRERILKLDTRIREEVKWNAPSFMLDDHFATFKLRPVTAIQLVLHTGAKVKAEPKPFTVEDPEQLLKWAAKDRCVLTLSSVEEAQLKVAAVERIVAQWIKQL